MDDTTDAPPAGAAAGLEIPDGLGGSDSGGAISHAFAGLQAGMVGALWMLAWLGIDSSWDGRGFWYGENLFASFFYGGGSIGSGFGTKTIPGLALYLILYSVLGCIFAFAWRCRPVPLRVLLAALIFAVGWFYLAFHFLWKSAMPLVYLLYPERPMLLGHVIFGVCLARFPIYLPGNRPRPAVRSAVTEVAPDAVPPAASDERGLHAAAPDGTEDGLADAAGSSPCNEPAAADRVSPPGLE